MWNIGFQIEGNFLTSFLPIYAWVSQLVSFPQASLSKPCIHISYPHTRYKPRPSYSSRFYKQKIIGWNLQIFTFHIIYFYALLCYLVPLWAAIARRRVVPSCWSGCQSTQNLSKNRPSGIKYWIFHICANCVGLSEKIGQNVEMSRYMCKMYKQKSKKRARLASSHLEESRKVRLTPAERAKAYRERKCLRALYQPLDWSFQTWTPTPRLQFYCAVTSTWTLWKTNYL